MKKNPKKQILLLFLIFTVLSLAGFCYALEAEYPDILGNSLSDDPSLPDYVSYFVNIGVAIAGILAGTVVALGGAIYMVNGALGKSKSEALEWVKSGILGLILLITAYIILSTINPALVKPQIGQLLDIIPYVGTHISNLNGPQQIFYKEIPIGTLTETVLARTINCYDFDDLGDPIMNEIKTDDNGTIKNGPAFLDHDRVDCMLKLNKAIEKKSKIIKNLSIKIADLMSSCNCAQTGGSGNDCKEMNGEKCPDAPPNIAPEDCTDKNINCGPGLKCECDGGSPNACEPEPNEFKLCPIGTKKKVQEGPITLDDAEIGSGISKATGNEGDVASLYTCIDSKRPALKKYKGLIEFDDDGLNPQAIINLVEAPPVKINGNDVVVINKQNWDNLRLVQQLIYLREKLNQMTTTLSQDSKNLESAGDELNKCYLAKTYVDYLKTAEQTDKNQTVLMVKKNYDSYQNKFTNISKYCNGFGYDNSSCYYTCENACPLYSADTLSCNESCQQPEDCDSLCQDDSPYCIALKTVCEQKQNTCLSDCFDKRQCPNSSSGNFQDFKGCMASCKNNCKDTCAEEYKLCSDTVKACETCKTQPNTPDPECVAIQKDCNNCYACVIAGGSVEECDETINCIMCAAGRDILTSSRCTSHEIGQRIGLDCNKIGCARELKKCEAKCDENSKCILESKERCLYNPTALIQCSGLNSDQKNIKNCIDNSAYTCKYGSDLQAGYPDCLKKPFSLQSKFSSSDIYKNIVDGKDSQKCPYPFIVDENSPCYSPNSPEDKCVESCPEVTKCPATSNCPDCPCSVISSDTDITDYRVVGGECQEFKYNDDPLTFYCEQNWWDNEELKNPEPLANSYVCPKEKEIPIGQTVDDTQKWARKLLDYNGEFIQKTDELIKRLKEISDQKDYCKCGSLCDTQTGERACNAPCSPAVEDTTDENGNVIEEKCVCANQGCQGNPCQKMINLLLGKSEDAYCPKGVPIDGPPQLYPQIKIKLDVIANFSIKSRTEIVKELIYSRKTIDDCSSESKANTVAQQTKLVSCERVDSNFISPIAGSKTILNGKEVNSPCYGERLGDIFSNPETNYETSDPTYIKPETIEPETDNWFCCNPRNKP